ncbi:MAG: ABC transporter ATP-binding protein [Myxococcales bacterium FL481]|nr:MAG: ABC transporter ATP-binding protein [Myxococcales bacterium FL481]
MSARIPVDTASCVARCVDLVKRYADVTAVAGIDLELRAGQCFGLLGPNGAGKTTTIEMMVGLTPCTSGVVEMFGMRWGTGHDADIRGRIGVVLQETQLADKLTVEEVIRMFRSFYPRGHSVDQVIDMLALGPKRKARYHQLSGGQKQRVALGVALVGQPELLFLDEPTTGLDPQARMSVWEIVEQYRRDGGTVVLTTHYMEEAAHMCDRIAIIDHGKIIAAGTPSELIAALGGTQLIELESDQELDAAALSALPSVHSTTNRGRRLVLHVDAMTKALPPVLEHLQRADVELSHLSTHDATLDDVFVSLTGRGLRDE